MQVQIAQRGLSVPRLSFQTATHLPSLHGIVSGTFRYAYLEILARLAQALNTTAQPFQIGDLFTWDDPRAHYDGDRAPGIRKRQQTR